MSKPGIKIEEAATEMKVALAQLDFKLGDFVTRSFGLQPETIASQRSTVASSLD